RIRRCILMEILRFPRQSFVGEGTAVTIPEVCVSYGERVILVTESVLLGQPKVSAVVRALEDRARSVEIFTEVAPEAPVSTAEALASVVRKSSADMILAVGGGTAIDLAKIAGIISRYGGSPERYYGESRVPGPN